MPAVPPTAPPTWEAHPQQPASYEQPQIPPQYATPYDHSAPQPPPGMPVMPGPAVGYPAGVGGPGGPGSPGSNRRLLFVVTGVLVAIAAIVTTVLVLVVGGGDDDKEPVAKDSTSASGGTDKDNNGKSKDPSSSGKPDAPGTPAALAAKWSVPNPNNSDRDVHGRWATADKIYLGDNLKGLIAYDVATGAPTPVALPAGAVVCGMSPGTSDGVGGIAWSENTKDCNKLALVELATGKLRWTGTFGSAPEGGGTETYARVGLDSIPMAFTDKALVVGTRASVVARAKTDGAVLWGKVAPKVGRYDRDVVALLSDGKDVLVTMQEIMSDTIGGAKFNGATGEPVWSNDLPLGKRAGLWPISVEPQVYVAHYYDSADKRVDEIITVDAAGKIAQRIPAEGPWGKLNVDELDWGGVGSRPGHYLSVDDGLLFGTVEDGGADEYSVVAIDLATGKPKWQTPAPGKALDIFDFLLAGSDDTFVYAVTGGYSPKFPLQVHRWNKADGTTATVAKLPDPPKDAIGLGMEPVWSDGRLLCVATTYATGPSLVLATK